MKTKSNDDLAPVAFMACLARWAKRGRRMRLPILSVLALSLGGCTSVLRFGFSEAQPFSFFGQVAVGAAVADGRRFHLPVFASGGQLMQNSGIIPWKIETEIHDRTIELTVYTTLADGKHPGVSGIDLPAVPPGGYEVVYRDPDGSRHPLARVVLPQP